MFEEAETWVAIAFVIFVVLTYRPIGRFAAGALDGRADQIKHEIDEAQRLREEAQHMLAEYQRKQRDAATEAEAVIKAAIDDAEAMRHEARDELQRALTRREALATARIEQAEVEATQQIRNLAIDIAIAAAAKVLGDRLGEDGSARIIDNAISELPGKLH